MINAKIIHWKVFKDLQLGERFLIPGDITVYRKRSENSYHPTYWELYEQDPESPIVTNELNLLVQFLGE